MYRALHLAKNGAGQTAPNPMVGAVLVFENRIIGEGWHQKFGTAHAEPNCINNVKTSDRHLISQSTLYVTLEPCSHYGKTPPCANIIIEYKISKIVIACTYPNPQVAGKGITILKEAGVTIYNSQLRFWRGKSRILIQKLSFVAELYAILICY